MNLSGTPSDEIEKLIAKKILNSYSGEFLKEFKKYKKTGDTEAMHQLRIYSRRLRSAFDFFSTVLPAKKKKEWNREIKRFLTALNLPRDTQVQLNYIKPLCRKNNDCMLICNEILQYLQKREKKQAKQLANAFERVADKDFITEILQYGKKANNKAFEVLSPSNLEILGSRCLFKLKPLLSEFSTYRSYLPDVRKVQELHKCRLLMKKIKYTLEILTPSFPSNK